jgi:hypothetical protein
MILTTAPFSIPSIFEKHLNPVMPYDLRFSGRKSEFLLSTSSNLSLAYQVVARQKEFKAILRGVQILR